MAQEPPGTRERRRHHRVPLKIPVDYSSVDAFFTEFSANINEGGMFIELENPPEIDTEVQLQFDLPGHADVVQVSGRVVWISDGKDGSAAGVGIEFQNLDADTRDTINRIVRDLRA